MENEDVIEKIEKLDEKLDTIAETVQKIWEHLEAHEVPASQA